jgi:subtilase-type serine protease
VITSILHRRLLPALVAMAALSAPARPAAAQYLYSTLNYGTTATFLSGIRGDNIVGNYVVPSSANTGGLLYSLSTGMWSPFPVATSSGSNFPGASSSSPYGPSFGSKRGTLRVVGSYKVEGSPNDLGYLYDGAAPPKARLITLVYPGSLNTIPHSTFEDRVVGNYDTQLQTGNAFIYNISTRTYETNNFPAAVSTTAYGIWASKIAGGYALPGPGGGPGFQRGYIYDQTTKKWTSYNHPFALITHFEGITAASRAGEYNLVNDWIDANAGEHASVLHLDSRGRETWIEIAVPGAMSTSANSAYQNTVVGVYVDGSGGTNGYIVTIPGI